MSTVILKAEPYIKKAQIACMSLLSYQVNVDGKTVAEWPSEWPARVRPNIINFADAIIPAGARRVYAPGR